MLPPPSIAERFSNEISLELNLRTPRSFCAGTGVGKAVFAATAAKKGGEKP
jgi:hypothetical protein